MTKGAGYTRGSEGGQNMRMIRKKGTAIERFDKAQDHRRIKILKLLSKNQVSNDDSKLRNRLHNHT